MNWLQLRTIIWLRWRLSRNQFARGGKLNAIISVIGSVLTIVVVIGAGVGGVIVGAFGMASVPPLGVLGIWDGITLFFLFLWIIGIIAELQRSESLDIGRMLHLPVSLRGVFVMNYLASLITFSIIIFLPATMGICLGQLWAKGPLTLLLCPLVLSFLFMVTAWTYCLRGWLVTLMVNPRKRRNVLFGLTITIILIAQAPNFYFNVYLRQQRNHQAEIEKSLRNPADSEALSSAKAAAKKTSRSRNGIPTVWIAAQNYVPFLWLPKGAMAIAEGDAWPPVLGSAGAFLLGAIGLARAYRSTIRFYQGSEKIGVAKQSVQFIPGQPRAATPANFIEKKVPYVTEDVAAMALAFLRSAMRAPEVKMSLFTSVIMVAAMVPVMTIAKFNTSGQTMQLFGGTGVIGLTFFGLLQQMFNHFGFDRDGFRALVLAPVRRQDILFAKNLALAPFVVVIGVCFFAVLWFGLHFPPLLIMAGFFQLGATYLLLSVAGNLTSIWVPFRVTAGSLKPTKPPAKTVLLIFLAQLLFPIVMIPVFFAPALGLLSDKLGWWPAPVVDLLFSICLFAVMVFIYRFSLADLGRMLEQREKKILLVVSQEVD